MQVNRYKLDRQNRYSRRENVRIFGLTIDQGKSLTDTVIDMLNHIASVRKCEEA
jgi:hypothetical protein